MFYQTAHISRRSNSISTNTEISVRGCYRKPEHWKSAFFTILLHILDGSFLSFKFYCLNKYISYLFAHFNQFFLPARDADTALVCWSVRLYWICYDKSWPIYLICDVSSVQKPEKIYFELKTNNWESVH